MTVSWLGNTNFVPSGTTVTRGENCLSRCLISTVWPFALERSPSMYTYASPIGWPPAVRTRPLTVAASWPEPPLSLLGSLAPPPFGVIARAVGDGGGGNDDTSP